MTPPPAAPLLLLTSTHSAVAAAALLLLDPSSASPASARKRRRRDDEDSSSGAGTERLDDDEPVPPAQPPLPLPPTSPDHFPLAFRVSAPTFHFLAGLLDPLLSHPSLPSPVLLALALARLASGLPYPALAGFFRVPPSAARAASRRLRRVLLANFRFWLAFPTEPSTTTASTSSARPSCRGSLACARFAGPAGSLSAQIVAGSSSRVLSLAAGFRGDRTDLEVLKLSSLYQEVEQGRVLDSTQYLVGDGAGYPLLPWLMVPFPGPVATGSPEADFNRAHKAMCRPVRRAVRSLMGWGAIARLREEESPRAAVACIGTCAMLHNVLLTREDYSALAPEEEEEATTTDLGGTQNRGDSTSAAAEGLEVDRRALAIRSTLAATMRNLYQLCIPSDRLAWQEGVGWRVEAPPKDLILWINDDKVAAVEKHCTVGASCSRVSAPYRCAVVVSKFQGTILPEGELGALAIHRSITVCRPSDSLVGGPREPDGEGEGVGGHLVEATREGATG